MTIWKYGINWGTTELFMPKGAKILSVQIQNDRICIWAMVDPLAPKEVRTFTTYGTGYVERAVVGAAQSDTVIDSTYMPDTWFDHFKQHFWDRWWMPKRWVAKPKMRKVPTVLRRYNICPHLKADLDKHHMKFLFLEQDAEGGE